MKKRAPHPRTGDQKTRRGRQTAQPGRGSRRGMSSTRDRRVDLAPLEGSIWWHEGQRRQATEGARDRDGRLKRIVADLTLDNAMLKEVAKGNF